MTAKIYTHLSDISIHMPHTWHDGNKGDKGDQGENFNPHATYVA